MAKYHISKSGKPSICRAKNSCPLGGESEHFDNKEAAQSYADKVNESETMNINKLKEKAIEDTPENDVYRTGLYKRNTEDKEPRKFNLSELKAKDFEKDDSGASISTQKSEYVDNGFAVSPYPEHSKAINGKLTDEQLQKEIKDYVEEHKELLSKENHIVGLWRSPHDKSLYLDVSIVVDKAEKARDISEKKDQQAYFDFQTFKAITVDPSASSGQQKS